MLWTLLLSSPSSGFRELQTILQVWHWQRVGLAGAVPHPGGKGASTLERTVPSPVPCTEHAAGRVPSPLGGARAGPPCSSRSLVSPGCSQCDFPSAALGTAAAAASAALPLPRGPSCFPPQTGAGQRPTGTCLSCSGSPALKLPGGRIPIPPLQSPQASSCPKARPPWRGDTGLCSGGGHRKEQMLPWGWHLPTCLAPRTLRVQPGLQQRCFCWRGHQLPGHISGFSPPRCC